ncbi:MAG: nucleoside-diphosphate sugar epimerase [Chloroflexi bacterium]|nr:nucleoside-diphosphate sugar epimerase [Chloroflexota bacterium]|tara:strand:+ start:97 stop:1083 length:987 start_codon:yes stop_codon:yes gene_type:complete
MNNILITGGAGFIGSHLAEKILNEGDKVTIIDDLSTGKLNNINHLLNNSNLEFINDSILNIDTVDRLIKNTDIIFHLAAAVGVYLIVKDPVKVIETNILGTHSILQLASKYNKKVLIASTSEIYGKNSHVPFNEEDDRILGPTTKSRWSYSTSKAVDEFLGLAYHKQNGLAVTIFRLFNTVGPKQESRYGMVIPRLIDQSIQKKPLTVYGDGLQTRCFCDVDDVVNGILALSKSKKAIGEVFNIGSNIEISILDLAKKILQIVRKNNIETLTNNQIKFVPYDEAYEVGFEDMLRRVPDTTKIKSLIGWEPKISLDQTLNRIISEKLAN